jgi:hypothetical protein
LISSEEIYFGALHRKTGKQCMNDETFARAALLGGCIFKTCAVE